MPAPLVLLAPPVVLKVGVRVDKAEGLGWLRELDRESWWVFVDEIDRCDHVSAGSQKRDVAFDEVDLERGRRCGDLPERARATAMRLSDRLSSLA